MVWHDRFRLMRCEGKCECDPSAGASSSDSVDVSAKRADRRCQGLAAVRLASLARRRLEQVAGSAVGCPVWHGLVCCDERADQLGRRPRRSYLMSPYSKDAAGSAKRYRPFRWFPHSNSFVVGQLFHPSHRTSYFVLSQHQFIRPQHWVGPPLALGKSPQ